MKTYGFNPRNTKFVNNSKTNQYNPPYPGSKEKKTISTDAKKASDNIQCPFITKKSL